MSGEDACRVYHNVLNSYEKEEIRTFQTVYYLNTNKKRADQDDVEGKTFNHGYDTEDGEYLYEANDHINYRYEIIKRLGKGAFGVVLKCIDHLTKEAVALKILKN
jgi:dual specificity tyrosine-phosphorylation-regulated kinase 2/3/4